ncbi:MAG: circularly permuted type 2 ATP-grasp protein [Inquilinus sp.]|uniref:circularly permuted type 2 ATP-grasp protein n=1 Tax=Inquilinus sp. TaxID=1932117 RepID=UPI003F3FA829
MTAARTAARRLQDWIAGYTPLPGVPDELIGPDGKPRAYWRDFLDVMARLAPEEAERRFAAADRHIRDTGVSYRVHGEASERSWPLSRVPLLVSAAEWREIEAGVIQRAELLETVLRDLYGDGRLVAEGALPAAAVAGSPDFLRPLHGVAPPGGKFLHLYAADLGRGPDGRWWVLNDRTQAPSGAGYALENRLILSRALPALYREMNVDRLAPFFGALRAGLAAVADRSDPRICLLSSGRYSETYFEQAHLARYLGLMLVEGDDLVLHDGRIHVRTIAGLKRADVLWRRVDADFCDPLELNTSSRLGVPGLLEAIRGGQVVVANMPGAGLAEARILLSFLPALCRRLRGEELRLPNVATWWCGQPQERETVLAALPELAVAGAFGATVPGFPGQPSVLGAEAPQRARLEAAIRTRPVDYVGQEVARLSTTPAWQDGKLVPRPFVLRVFAAATPEGWKVMPGGFCRISDRPDARAVSMGQGVQTADVWILADRPVEATSLLPRRDRVPIRRIAGNLPSHAADNLFWFGRYLERAEATLRLVRRLCSSLVEADPAIQGSGQTLDRLQKLLVAWGAVPRPKPGDSGVAASAVAAAALNQAENYGAAIALVRSARRASSAIRERLSADSWPLLAELEERLGEPGEATLSEGETFHRADRALHVIAALSGLAQENMNQVAGWRFLDMGRRIERGINTCRFARHLAEADTTIDDLDALLDLIDSQISYRSRYVIGPALAPVRDMVMLDPYNPRAVAFQVERLLEHLKALPSLREDGMPEAPLRLATIISGTLSAAQAESLDNSQILGFEQKLMQLSEAVADRYFLQGRNAARPEKLTGLY